MLVNIQFLRFVAATLVVLYHAAAFMPSTEGWANLLFAVGGATGYAGVDIFFVISGFIMAHTTLAERGAGPASAFARRRLARIYSGYWPFFALAVVLFAWARPEHFARTDLWASFWLWPQPLPSNLIELSWTLSFELYFYALFTALVWWCPPQRRVTACLAVLLALAAFNAWRHLAADAFGYQNLLLLGFWDQFLTSPYIVEFFAGSVLAYWLQGNPRGPGWAALLAGCALFLAGGAISEGWFEGHLEQGYHVVPRVGVFGAASVLIVTGLVWLEARGWVAPKRFALLTGGASYAIYLSHGPLLVAAHHLGFGTLLERHGWLPVSASYLALVAGIVALSCLHYRRVERPLHHAFRRLLGVRAGAV